MKTINAAPSTVGEILYEEFLKPLDMPPARLAELMDTTYEKIWEIIKNERDITLEEATGVRLENGKYPTLRLFAVQIDVDSA